MDMIQNIAKKSYFIATYIIFFILWLIFTTDNKIIANIGISIFTLFAYIIALNWMWISLRTLQTKHRYFWVFILFGTALLFVSKLISIYQQVQYVGMHHYLIEETLRLVGYLLYFIGLIYHMKIITNILPMLRFLLNIVIVIIAAYCVSWFFIVNPLLIENREFTQMRFFISSIYHVLNISLLFGVLSLIQFTRSKQSQKCLYLIAAGFLIQVVGDFFFINNVKHGGDWIFILWPMSVLLMGLSAVISSERQEDLQFEKMEQLEYKNYYLPIISAAVLLSFTFINDLYKTNTLQKGLYLTVLLLLLQQVITAFENKNIFVKLKQLASPEGGYLKNQPNTMKRDNEITKLLRKIETLAHYDSLTKLPNRNFFQKCLEKELQIARGNESGFSLFYIDLDRFKYVNDSLGHDCGDILLQQVADRLKMAVAEYGIVARVGGDEFAIIINKSDKFKLEKIASRILQEFDRSFMINGHELYSTPSIGISIYPEGGNNEKELLKSADAAMYLAKEEGKNKYKFYNKTLNEVMIKKMNLETRLRRALEENSFSLHYQPQVDLRTEKIIGLEALLRWTDADLGTVSPAEFIPIAEETGLIENIGHWVIKTACIQMKQWQKMGYLDISISVNVSIRQFQNPHFVKEVKSILTETGLAPRYLKIEITESILQDLNKTLTVLNDLNDLGIQIAIDDFGTGYSSLSYLKNLPVSCLKIDKAFIDELESNPEGPIVKTIIDMGRNMNFTVIAEGVELKEQALFLKENKCLVGQGFLFSKPLSDTEMELYLKRRSLMIS